jgi:hypothetical protein
MTEPSLVSLFVRPLNRLGLRYMVSGGVASVVYGEPRFTRDIDLVIALLPRDAPRFASAWPADEFYVPPVEVIAAESRRPADGHFNVIHLDTTMRADIYLPGDDSFNAWGLEHRVTRQVDGDDVALAPIETVILNKLRYYQMGKSDRHLRDIHQMVRVSGELVNAGELERWIGVLGLKREWQLARDFRDS